MQQVMSCRGGAVLAAYRVSFARSVPVGIPASPELLPAGSAVTFDNCAREAIHQPGAVQPHGVLFVARVSDGTIVQASTNASVVLGPVASSPLHQLLADVIGDGPAALLLGLSPGDDSPPQSATVTLDGRAFDGLVYCPAPGFRVRELEPVSQDDADDGTEMVRPAGVRRLLEQLGAMATLGYDRSFGASSFAARRGTTMKRWRAFGALVEARVTSVSADRAPMLAAAQTTFAVHRAVVVSQSLAAEALIA